MTGDDQLEADFDDEELASIVSEAPSLPAIMSDDAERFAIEVRRIVESRASQDWPNEKPEIDEAIFVLVDYPREVAKRLGASPVVDLPDLSLPIFGRVFFLSKDASNGSFLNLPCNQAEVLNWLEDNKFEQCPLVIARRGTMKVSIRKTGATGGATHEVIRKAPPDLSADELEMALENFHMHNLVTPYQCESGIWEPERSADYVPVKQVEKEIQKRLRILLTGWFRGVVKVEPEDSVPAGRIDVRLLAPSADSNGLNYWAIIELKVAKSYRNARVGCTPATVSNNKNAKEISSGVRQIDSYSNIRDLDEGYLEVFDMRKDKSEDLLSHSKVVEALARSSGTVRCNVRPIFGRAEDARDSGVVF